MQNKIGDFWHAERPQWILWLPVIFGAGVGVYFAIPEEEPLAVFAVTSLVCFVNVWLLRLRGWPPVAYYLLFLLGVFMAGMSIASLRTQAVDAPILEHDIKPRPFSGRIVEIAVQPAKTRLVLDRLVIERLEPEQTPLKTTLSLRGAPPELNVGDRIEGFGGFFPPPKPVLPGGFAFNRHFYFKQIGAVGYGIGDITVTRHNELDDMGLMNRLNAWRTELSARLRQEMGSEEGAVAAALVTGDGKSISESVRESMRSAGLAHVLAISGMHLGLVAGILFFVIRYALVFWPDFALKHDAKKWAACFALLGALGYLFMAGLPISAQRAFVMVCLVLLAVVLDRFVTPVRSLALAAAIILLITPESLLTPSFQLSFAATLGILAYYEHWRKQAFDPEKLVEPGWRRKFWRFWGGIVLTSSIATLATMPFVLHHFDDFPVYSIIGNLLVLPILSFLIMPLIVVMIMLLPVGLEEWIFWPLEHAIGLMIRLAQWIESWPVSTVSLPPLATNGLILVVAGGLWLCLWQQRWRHFGWIAIMAGLATLLFYTPPDLVISDDGKKLAIRTAPERVVMLRGRSSGFTQDQWLRYLRVDAFERYDERQDAPQLRCDNQGCMMHGPGVALAITEDRSALPADCRKADALIAPEWSLYRAEEAFCQMPVYDWWWIRTHMGAAFWRTEAGGLRVKTVREELGNRPWSGLRND